MTNLLEQAINSNHVDHAAKLIQGERSASRAMKLPTTSFTSLGPATVSSALGLSANGCRLRRVSLPDHSPQTRN